MAGYCWRGDCFPALRWMLIGASAEIKESKRNLKCHVRIASERFSFNPELPNGGEGYPPGKEMAVMPSSPKAI